MGNAKSKNYKYDSYSYSGKGPPRSNSDPSSILYASQKQHSSFKGLKKLSKKSKKSSKSNTSSQKTTGRINHGSSNSIHYCLLRHR